ncbi:hypothetical protein ACJW31_04G055600 [Castanea mollissima]
MIVRDGNAIRIWDDPWIPDLQGFIPIPKSGANPNGILLVSQLLNSEHSDRDYHKLKLWFEDSIEDLILRISFSLVAGVDCWVWTPSSSWVLSVKSANWICKEAHRNNDSGVIQVSSPISKNPCRFFDFWKLEMTLVLFANLKLSPQFIFLLYAQ